MSKSSINFQPVKYGSEIHNKREKILDYVYPELSINNECFVAENISSRRGKIDELYFEKVGQKMQKKATPIREAVVNLLPHHNMKDLKKLAAALNVKFGIEIFQIHIHRDEGKDRKNLNYHAHILADWQNKKTGRTIKLKPLDMVQIQDLTAEVLGMERGISNNHKRLPPIAYKIKKKEEELKELNAEYNELLDQKKKLKKQLSSGFSVKNFQQKLRENSPKSKLNIWREKVEKSGKIWYNAREELEKLEVKLKQSKANIQNIPDLKMKLKTLEQTSAQTNLKLKETRKTLKVLHAKNKGFGRSM